ncbi:MULTISPECIES: hypothetical protein [unclassified Streptomyces]|uniref:hypothetical protein n=1 Tax=unclassified Streptomyces TaxID=2593676 RepID=UPI0036EA3F31
MTLADTRRLALASAAPVRGGHGPLSSCTQGVLARSLGTFQAGEVAEDQATAVT